MFEQNCSRAFAFFGFLTIALRRAEIAWRSFINGVISLLQNSFCANAGPADTPRKMTAAAKAGAIAENRRSISVSASWNCETRYRVTEAPATSRRAHGML